MVIAARDPDVGSVLSLGEPTYFDQKGIDPYIPVWPHADESLDRVTITHVLEYLPGTARIAFINELWRCLVPGGRATLYLPYWSSPNSHADPYLRWPPISELSVQYLASAEFRARNRLDYPELRADFDLRWGESYAPEWHIRSDSTRTFAHQHYLGIVTEVVYTLTRRES